MTTQNKPDALNIISSLPTSPISAFRIYRPASASELFPNPERGFYSHTETHSNRYTSLRRGDLQNLGTANDPDAFRRNRSISLILRLFYLDDFVRRDITNRYLLNMEDDFGQVRGAGLKAIVRFAYTNTLRFAPGTKWPPIPPYGDADGSQVKRHLEQLKQVLRSHSDVIAVVQAGFIGVWGEWYYTDHFVAAPNNPGSVTPVDYIHRRDILDPLLDVMPISRMVQVRTPLNKQQMYGTAVALNSAEAYTNINRSRIGYHNDCFLASDTDMGTYSQDPATRNQEKAYLEAETNYLPMGGETCQANSPRSDWTNASVELARFHWSYLNIDYHRDVLNSWNAGGHLDEINRRLGYRFTLNSGYYTEQVRPGKSFAISIRLQNVGWAAPFNPRDVKLVLRNNMTNAVYSVKLPDDPRRWLPNATHSINYTIGVPNNMPTGNYNMFLHLPDPEPRLSSQSKYAIRFANSNIWESNTGYNKLDYTIRVSNTAPDSAIAAGLVLSP